MVESGSIFHNRLNEPMKSNNMTNTTSKSQKARLFNFLAKGKEVSIVEASKRLNIANPSAVVAQLREDGARIYTNRRSNAAGQTVFKYRLDLARSDLS